MKQKSKILFLLAVLVCCMYFARAQEPLSISGDLDSRTRLRYNDNWRYSWNENRLQLNLEKKFSLKARFNTSVWLRTWGLPGLIEIDDLYNIDNFSPYNLSLREAYVDLYAFIFDKMDVRIGRQRIAWGTGDGINPTDNLNPYDLENLWEFGRHLPSEAIKINYYFDRFDLEAVFIPFYKPAVLPRGDWSEAFTQSSNIEFPSAYEFMGVEIPVIIDEFRDSLQMPAFNLGESSIAGLKVSGLIWNYDVSLSYLYGRDGLPLPVKLDVIYEDFNLVPPSINLSIQANLSYMRHHILGFDFAGAIKSVGVWGEAAAFVPQSKVVMKTEYQEFPQNLDLPEVPDSLILANKTYFKYLLGADYTFGFGGYLNFQYLHGFFHERGDELNDYFLISYDHTFLNDQLTVKPLAGAIVISDWSDIRNNYALIFSPEVEYRPNDNASLALGVRILDGKGQGAFAGLGKKDELFLKLKYSF